MSVKDCIVLYYEGPDLIVCDPKDRREAEQFINNLLRGSYEIEDIKLIIGKMVQLEAVETVKEVRLPR